MSDPEDPRPDRDPATRPARGGAPRGGRPQGGSGDPRRGAPERGGRPAGAGRGRPGSDRATGSGSRDAAHGDRSGAPGRGPRPSSGERPRSDDRRSDSRGGGPRADSRGSGARPDSRGGGPRSDSRGGGPRADSRGSGARPDSRGGGPRSDSRGGARPDSRGGAPRAGGGRPRPERGGPEETFERPPKLEIPSWAKHADLDPSVRSALRTLSPRAAEEVSGHLAAAAELLDDDPKAALAHARVARSHAARVALVREAVGIAAYRAEEWTEALSELRAAHRMSGEPYLVPLLMDSERALGRPQAALKLAEQLRGKRLDPATRVELAVVMSGVRRDLGSPESALAVLEREDLQRKREPELSVRLWYAYADALEAAGRRDDAARWFGEAAGLDREGVTDAADRAAALL